MSAGGVYLTAHSIDCSIFAVKQGSTPCWCTIGSPLLFAFPLGEMKSKLREQAIYRTPAVSMTIDCHCRMNTESVTRGSIPSRCMTLSISFFEDGQRGVWRHTHRHNYKSGNVQIITASRGSTPRWCYFLFSPKKGAFCWTGQA
jgi:hypothetical protein